MRRRSFLAGLAGATLAAAVGRAQPVARVGLIGIGSADNSKFVVDALRQGLGALGYRVGANLIVLERYTHGDPSLTPGLAADLIDRGVDAIVTAGEAVYAAHQVTATVPIVMAGSGDVVASGLAQSLAHPGGNVTGTIALQHGIMAKRLGLFKQIVPTMRRAGALLRRGESMNAVFLANLASTAKEADVELQAFEAADAESYEAAFSSAKAASVDAFVVLENGQFFQDAEIIADLALRHRLPLCGASVMASKGMLLGYSPDPAEMWRNAARFVDKVVRGEKPGNIPIEQATTFRTVINLKTARALGLDIPPATLAAADEVIE